MERLYVIRHCETISNKKNIISGQSDIPITNCVINMQNYKNISETLIFSSPLTRCIRTAEEIKLSINYKNDIIIDDRLIERGMGIWENEKREIIKKKYPEYFSKGKFIFNKTPPEGEEYNLFSNRIEFFINDLYNLQDNDIIICSHNQTLKMLYAIMMNIPLENIWYEKDFKNGVLEEIIIS